MKIRYGHTNIISKDWKRLCDFYMKVFECSPVLPSRNQSGSWLEKGTGVSNARLEGMHLRLPGYGDDGPTLEIFKYSTVIDAAPALANRQGFGHIAFQVEDVQQILRSALENGGNKIGELSEQDIEGVGHLTFIYIADPDGNIIELQNWKL